MTDEQLDEMNVQLDADDRAAEKARSVRNDKLQMMSAFIVGGIASQYGTDDNRCAERAIRLARELLAQIEALP